MSIRPSLIGSRDWDCAAVGAMHSARIRRIRRMDASPQGDGELSGQESPVVKALPAYSAAVIELLSQHFSWVQNPVVVARQVLAGISNGMLLFLISAGLSLIFGVLRIINFAHGVLFMLGAFVAVSMLALAPGGAWAYLGALGAATAALAALGAVTEAGLLRRIY